MFPKFDKITLENGLEVYAIPVNLGSSVISVDIFYNVGSKDEIMGKSGIAHMLEHMNFKSTKNRKAGEFDKIVKGFGGVNNASTGFDYTHYFIKCSNANLEKSLELYADIMQNLDLQDDEFQPERSVVLEERRWRTDNDPSGYLFFRLYNTAFSYHSYHWTPIGFKEDIKNWTIDDIKDFHAKFYQPKNAVLIVAGDIEKDQIFDLAKKYFGNIENKSEIPQNHCTEPVQDGEKSAMIYKKSEVDIVAIAFKIPPFNHADQVGLNALEEYLSGGKSSLFQRVLVDEKKLANYVGIYNMSAKFENLFIIFAYANVGIKAEILRDEIFDLIEFAKNAEITDDDMTKIQNSVKKDFIYSLDSASKVASIFGDYIIRGDLDALFAYEKGIKNLQKANLKDCMEKYLVRKNSTTMILRKEENE